MKVGMILDHEFPFDERVEKEAFSLIGAGFDVFLLSPNSGYQSASENYKGLHIKRFKLNKKIRRKLNPTYLVLPFYRWIWSRYIERFIIENQIDILHIHDLPLADIGVKMKLKYKIKLVCDQHEYWSKWIVLTSHYNDFLGKIVKFFSNWEKYERENLKVADLLITVEEPLRQLYLTKIAIDSKKIIKVPNTPLREIFNENNIDTKVKEIYGNNFVLFYAGVVDVLRGLRTVVHALPTIAEEIPNVKFLIAGREAKGSNLLKEAQEINVDKYIEFLGWLPLERLPSFIAASDVCINIPPVISDYRNKIVPTKVYQYMAMRKPVIVGQSEFLKDFVSKYNIGFVINELDSKDLAKKIIQLNRYKHISKGISANYEKIAEKFYWEVTVGELIQSYKQLHN